MSVDNTHNFIANGIVSHNCDAMRYGTQDINGKNFVWSS